MHALASVTAEQWQEGRDHLNSHPYASQREATLPEPPHSLAAIGGTTVYAACKR